MNPDLCHGWRMDVSVEINCGQCGSANYSLAGGTTDDAAMQCNDCGSPQGSLGALKAAMAQLVLDQSAEALRSKLASLRGTAPTE